VSFGHDRRPEVSGPAVAIVAAEAVYLVDAGPGVVRRAAAAAERGISELRVQNLKIVFIADFAFGPQVRWDVVECLHGS
jgi:hypothetical protein